MRALYRLLLWLAAPFALLFLHLRGRRHGDAWGRWRERTGHAPGQADGVDVWVHAVSVGEVRAAKPVIDALLARHGDGRVAVTTITASGSEQVRHIWGDRVLHCYLPYDLPRFVHRFLQRLQPRAVVIMETELWPNTFAALAARGIPLVIANARLSPRSFAGYRYIGALVRETLRACALVAAQSEDDAARFRALGAPRVEAIGNIKFDVPLPQEQVDAGRRWREALGPRRPVWVAASTHDGEEAAVLAAHERILHWHPQALLILVPRHPQRFESVARTVARSTPHWVRRSQLDRLDALDGQQVLLADSMGEMFTWLAASDLAFVGGSLVEIGGHNVLEPAALGMPVLFGRHMFNFVEARRLLLEGGGAIEVDNAQMLAAEAGALLSDAERRARIGKAAAAAVAANRGAVSRLMAALDEVRAR